MGLNFMFDDNDAYDEDGRICGGAGDAGNGTDESDSILPEWNDRNRQENQNRDSSIVEEPFRTDSFDLPATSWGSVRGFNRYI